MTAFLSPICEACDRFEPEFGAQKCTAFPAGIPVEIYQQGFDHREPFIGDGGIRFELKAGGEKNLALYEMTKAAYAAAEGEEA